jgi:hypothetical protein
MDAVTAAPQSRYYDYYPFPWRSLKYDTKLGGWNRRAAWLLRVAGTCQPWIQVAVELVLGDPGVQRG